MATLDIPVLWNAGKPDTSGNVYAVPSSIDRTTAPWIAQSVAFKDSGTRIGWGLRFRVPQSYVGTAVVVITWASSVTTGNVVWDFDYRALTGDNAESTNQAGTQEAVTVTDGAGGTAWFQMIATISLTSGNFAANDEVQAIIYRDGSDAADTLAATTFLDSLVFRFNDA
jgi:hypothetical protein